MVFTLSGVNVMAGDSQEQAVIVHSSLPPVSSDELFQQIQALEDELETSIAAASVGEFDGNEIGEGELVLFMYGPDAEKLFAVTAPILRGAKLTQSGLACVRPGPPDAVARKVPLSAR